MDIPQTRALRLLTVIGVGLIAVLLVACEEATGTATPADDSPTAEVEATAEVRETATSSADPTATSVARPTSEVTPLSRTAVAGGSSTPARPTAVATTGSSGSRPTPPTGREVSTFVPDLSPFVGGQLVGLDDQLLATLVSEDAGIDSICNASSEGGSPFGANSIFNDFSSYGGPFGLNSPFNLESTTPPQVLVGGVFVGHLSVSPYVLDPIDPYAMLDLIGCPIAP